MMKNNISKGIIGTMRKLANRWADSDLLALASSLVARNTNKAIMMTTRINLLTHLRAVYT
jgi:hypothetical protein